MKEYLLQVRSAHFAKTKVVTEVKLRVMVLVYNEVTFTCLCPVRPLSEYLRIKFVP